MSIKVKVDDVVYSSVYDLVKQLNLQVKPSLLFKHYVKNKQEYSLSEIQEAADKINERMANYKAVPKINEINFGDLLYNMFYSETNELNKHLDNFILGLPFKDMPENTFVDYFTHNYKTIESFIPSKFSLQFFLTLIKQYKEDCVPDHILYTYSLNSTSLKKSIRCMPVRYYMEKYDLSYTTVYNIKKDFQMGVYKSYDEFINALEEKQRVLVQKTAKNKK